LLFEGGARARIGRMLVRRTVVAFVVMGCVALASTDASAKTIVTGHGRSPRTQAQMYDATIVFERHAPAQILNRSCARPSSVKDCELLSKPLRRALEAVLDRRITWVSHRPIDGPTFVVLAPIEWSTGEATASYAWRDTHKFSCFGGGSMSFKHDHGSWTAVLGSEYIGCPAR
jgi:hypothetical protein